MISLFDGLQVAPCQVHMITVRLKLIINEYDYTTDHRVKRTVIQSVYVGFHWRGMVLKVLKNNINLLLLNCKIRNLPTKYETIIRHFHLCSFFNMSSSCARRHTELLAFRNVQNVCQDLCLAACDSGAVRNYHFVVAYNTQRIGWLPLLHIYG